MPPKKESENNVSGNDAVQDNRIEQLTLVSRLLLYPATFFLGAGIFLGAVWANVSREDTGRGTRKKYGR